MIYRIRLPLPFARSSTFQTCVLIPWALLGTARWAVEWLGLPLRASWLGFILFGVLALSVSLGWLARHHLATLRPLWLAGLYLLWPIPQPRIGILLGGLTLFLWLIQNARLSFKGWWPEGLIFCGAMGIYLHTLAPTVLPADAGEFQLVIPLLGIAHPPGYALYTLLGKAFTFLPVGDIAYRVNLYGAVCGAATLAVVARCVFRLSGSRWGGLLGALALGAAPTFWAQSTTANIRSLMALLTALCLWFLLEWLEHAETRWLSLFALAFGLGVGHHGSLAFLALPFAVAILTRGRTLLRSPRRWVGPLSAFAASFLILLYLPIRSGMRPTFDPTPIRTMADFLNHVLARGFRGDMFYFRTPAQLIGRADVWANIMLLEFGPWLSLAMPFMAIPFLLKRRWYPLVAVGGAALVNILLALTYRAPQTVEYLIPSYVALAILLGGGAGLLAASLTDRGRSLGGSGMLAILIVLAFGQGAITYPSMRLLSEDRSERLYAESLLRDAPENALILANWHHATPLWYLQLVEGVRPDVTIRYVYPQGAKPNETVWLEAIAEAIASRPVIVTNRYYAYEHTAYRWIPFHGAWLVQKGPSWEVPPHIIPREALVGEVIRILGYELDDASPAPGETISLRVYWVPLRSLNADYSTFVQLLGPTGVVGQGDIPQPSRTYQPGEVRVDAYSFPLLLQTVPGTYRLITGFYSVQDGRWSRLPTAEGDFVTLQEITVRPASVPPPSLHPLDRAWANGLRLAGVDVDRSIPGQVRLYLHWRHRKAPFDRSHECPTSLVQALHGENVLAQSEISPLCPGQAATIVLDLPEGTRDVTLALSAPGGQAIPALGFWGRPTQSLALQVPDEERYLPLGGQMALTGVTYRARRGAMRVALRLLALRPLTVDTTLSVGLRGESWEIKDDGTPAFGAIPTLKWLAGWRVRDVRILPLEAPPQGAEAWLTLGAYDAFTLQPLHVLDERLVREGQGTEIFLARVRLPE